MSAALAFLLGYITNVLFGIFTLPIKFQYICAFTEECHKMRVSSKPWVSQLTSLGIKVYGEEDLTPELLDKLL